MTDGDISSLEGQTQALVERARRFQPIDTAALGQRLASIEATVAALASQNLNSYDASGDLESLKTEIAANREMLQSVIDAGDALLSAAESVDAATLIALVADVKQLKEGAAVAAPAPGRDYVQTETYDSIMAAIDAEKAGQDSLRSMILGLQQEVASLKAAETASPSDGVDPRVMAALKKFKNEMGAYIIAALSADDGPQLVEAIHGALISHETKSTRGRLS